ncbi:unnamed protein product, partial [marine sediment metagenome]
SIFSQEASIFTADKLSAKGVLYNLTKTQLF